MREERMGVGIWVEIYVWCGLTVGVRSGVCQYIFLSSQKPASLLVALLCWVLPSGPSLGWLDYRCWSSPWVMTSPAESQILATPLSSLQSWPHPCVPFPIIPHILLRVYVKFPLYTGSIKFLARGMLHGPDPRFVCLFPLQSNSSLLARFECTVPDTRSELPESGLRRVSGHQDARQRGCLCEAASGAQLMRRVGVSPSIFFH